MTTTQITRRTALGLGGAVAATTMVAAHARPALADDGEWPFTMGLNVSGLETGSVVPGTAHVDYAVPTGDQLDYYRQRALFDLRLPFRWERLQRSLGGELDADYLALIRELADHAAANGQRVLLDLHNYGRYDRVALGTADRPIELLADVWRRLATQFVGHPGVAGYHLRNEPYDMPGPSAWPDAAQAAVDAIREVDGGTTIYVEGDNWSSAFSWPTVNADLDVRDPADDLVYSAHTYLDRDSSGSHFDWDTEVAAGDVLYSPPRPLTSDTGRERVARFAAWLAERGARGHIGEIGTSNRSPEWLEALDRTLDYCREQGIPVNYWAAGPWFREYAMGVEPSLDGVDTAQMAVLTSYSGGASPRTYLFTGPNRGEPGSPSDPLTFDYRGLVTRQIRVTPRDGGAGGTFTPASQLIEPGFNGLATFTYTAPGTGTYRLRGGTNADLVDPPERGFSTRPDAYGGIDDDDVLTVLSPSLLYTPFIGAGARLRRGGDGQQRSFAYGPDDELDMAAVQAWAGGAVVRVVTLADQGPAGRDAGPVVTTNNQGPGGTRLPSSPADYPELVTDGPGGLAALRFDGSRMDAEAPIDGLTGFTCLVVARPNTVASMQRLLSWVVTDHLMIADNHGNWVMSGEAAPTQALGVEPGEWHIYGVRWQAGGQRTSWIDGRQIATTAASASSIPMAHDRHVNIGYFRWAPGVFFGGDVHALLPFAAALDGAQLDALWQEISARAGIPLQTL